MGEQWASEFAHKILLISVLPFACFCQGCIREFTDLQEAHVMRPHTSYSTY